MHKSLIGRRSSTNPVRISSFDREDKNTIRADSRRTQILKSKGRSSSGDNSQIPRPRIRTSSVDASSRKSNLKSAGKTPLSQHGPTTPSTPLASSSRVNLGLLSGSTIRGRSPSAERASGIGAKGPRKDTRPLTDKTYQAVMLNKIDNYFHTIAQSSMLNSNGSLRPITLKIFVEVSALLVKLLDIKQSFTINNYVEELPKIAKKLHYPGVMNKSWLKTANAMHSWPQVLGWLCWLVEVCEAKDLAAETFQFEALPFLDTDGKGEMNRSTFESMLKLYNVWNDEKFDEEALLVERYLQQIADQHGVTEKDLIEAQRDLDNEINKMQVIEEKCKETDEEVKKLEEIVVSLRGDEAKLLNYFKVKEEYIQDVVMETEKINNDSNILREEIQKHKIRQEELNVFIEEQPMSVVERDKIVEKCIQIQNYMHQFDDHLKDIEKEIYTLDIKLASVRNNLNKMVLAYNKDIITHLNSDAEANLDELKMPEKGILSAQIMDILNTKANLMNDLKKTLSKRLSEKESSIEFSANQLETLREKLKSLQEEKKDYIEKFNERKVYMNNIKMKVKADETKLREQIKVLQSEIKDIQESIPDVELASNELAEVKDKLDAVQRRKHFLEKSANRFFNRLYQIIAAHRTEVHDILKKLNKPND